MAQRAIGRLLRPFQDHRVRLALVAATVMAYAVAFHPVYQVVGPVVGALAIVPITVSGLCFGLRAGLVVPLLLAPLSAGLQTSAGTTITPAHGALGTAMMLVVGSVTGALRDFFVQVRAQARTLCAQQEALAAEVDRRTLLAAALRASNECLERTVVDLGQAIRHQQDQERFHALGQLASGIAHDFNNNLTLIIGFAELLLSDPEAQQDPVAVRRHLERILESAQGASAVVSRLRDLYRSRPAGNTFRPVLLDQLILQVVALTRPRWRADARAQGRTIELRTELSTIPPVLASDSELREAFTNLVLNAVDALPNGGTIAITVQDIDGEAQIMVTDDGLGMDDDVRRRCLEPFFTTKGDAGSGLGLSMVDATVQRHGGSLDIESVPGQGTTVRLRLPYLDPTTVSIETCTGQAGQNCDVAAVRSPRPASQPRLRVLVVDDDPDVRSIIVRTLFRDGHEPETVESGRAALDALAHTPFDVLITNRSMPSMSGDTLAATVKLRYPSVAVVMLTGFGEMMAAAGNIPAGVDILLPKPLKRIQLRQVLAAISTTTTHLSPAGTSSTDTSGVDASATTDTSRSTDTANSLTAASGVPASSGNDH